MQRLGMTGTTSEEQRLASQLALHGVQMSDIRWIVHTHHHIDHAGQDHLFPDATVIANRRELEYSASGLMGAQYPPEYVKHHIDRLHTPGALRLLDLELSGPDEVLPGIVCEAAGGHTEGSMNVLVETEAGVACICGDIVYHVHDSLIDPFHVSPRLRAAGERQPRELEAAGEGGYQEGSELRAIPAPYPTSPPGSKAVALSHGSPATSFQDQRSWSRWAPAPVLRANAHPRSSQRRKQSLQD